MLGMTWGDGGGEGLLGAKAPRPSGRCLRQRSLASLESNLSRSFSSFPMGQNIEYRRIIGLRCFLRRWWWGRIRTFEVDDGRFTVCSLWPLRNPTGVKSHCRLFSKMNGGGERITRRYLSSPFGPLPAATFSRWRSSRTLVEGSYPSR